MLLVSDDESRLIAMFQQQFIVEYNGMWTVLKPSDSLSPQLAGFPLPICSAACVAQHQVDNSLNNDKPTRGIHCFSASKLRGSPLL
jgi:hypothetical protein